MGYLILILALLITFSQAQAFPPFLKEYNDHPQAKKEFKQNCGLCHLAPEGGGERNDFGESFAREGAAITKELIQKFPQNFNQREL